MTGIIDIGTNTIRYVIYENSKIISNNAVRSEIIRDTKDANLTNSGIETLCNAINTLISIEKAEKNYAIATQSFRVLKNKDEVIEKVYKKTGIKIEVISGEEEAECVFSGVWNEINEKTGIIIDLGGGSAEIIGFEDEKINFLKSRPVGTKVIKNKFSEGIYPTEEESEQIRNYIEKNVEKKTIDGNLFMTGGTAKTALHIYNAKSNKNYITVKETEEILSFIKGKKEEELKEIFSTRYDTIAVGIIIIRELARIFNKEKIYIVKSGVREGYLIKKEMNI